MISNKNGFLVVDDEPGACWALESILASHGGAQSVGSADEAMRAISNARFAAVFVDYKLPGASGLELVRDLRAVDCITPIILTTGYAKASIAREFCSLGGSAILYKPFTADEAIAALVAVNQRQALAREQASLELIERERGELEARARQKRGEIARLEMALGEIEARIEANERLRLRRIRFALCSGVLQFPTNVGHHKRATLGRKFPKGGK